MGDMNPLFVGVMVWLAVVVAPAVLSLTIGAPVGLVTNDMVWPLNPVDGEVAAPDDSEEFPGPDRGDIAASIPLASSGLKAQPFVALLANRGPPDGDAADGRGTTTDECDGKAMSRCTGLVYQLAASFFATGLLLCPPVVPFEMDPAVLLCGEVSSAPLTGAAAPFLWLKLTLFFMLPLCPSIP